MRAFDTQERIKLIDEEILVLNSRIEEHGTGHIHTAINVLQHRKQELEQQFLTEQQQRNK